MSTVVMNSRKELFKPFWAAKGPALNTSKRRSQSLEGDSRASARRSLAQSDSRHQSGHAERRLDETQFAERDLPQNAGDQNHCRQDENTRRRRTEQAPERASSEASGNGGRSEPFVQRRGQELSRQRKHD